MQYNKITEYYKMNMIKFHRVLGISKMIIGLKSHQ